MKKITSLLLVILLVSSCGSIDDEPIVEQPLRAGETGQSNVNYIPINTNFLFDDLRNNQDYLVADLAIDLDDDGLNDLQFELSSSMQSNLQVLGVKSLNTTQLQSTNEDEFLLLTEAGKRIDTHSFNPINDQWLIMLYTEAGGTFSSQPIMQQPAYLPIQLTGRPGWLELQLLTDARHETIWGLHIRRLALLQE